MGGIGKYEDLVATHPDVVAGIRARLDWGSKRDEETGCLEWQGPTSTEGYGLLWALAKVWTVHRLTWMLEKEEISAEHLVCHHCDNRKCREFSHLFLGTRVENMDDMRTKERVANLGHRKATAEQVARILELRKGGATLRRIEAEVGCSMWTARRICLDAGCVPETVQSSQGTRIWRPEYTERALQMQADGKRLREIAEVFGVTAATVHHYIGCKRDRIRAAEDPLSWIEEGEPVEGGTRYDAGFDFGS